MQMPLKIYQFNILVEKGVDFKWNKSQKYSIFKLNNKRPELQLTVTVDGSSLQKRARKWLIHQPNNIDTPG
jgi:hypothetical protein